jgi:hypothetical protein
MCIFMSMIFILIQIKFDIDINNDELLKTIREHKKRKNNNSWSIAGLFFFFGSKFVKRQHLLNFLAKIPFSFFLKNKLPEFALFGGGGKSVATHICLLATLLIVPYKTISN